MPSLSSATTNKQLLEILVNIKRFILDMDFWLQSITSIIDAMNDNTSSANNKILKKALTKAINLFREGHTLEKFRNIYTNSDILENYETKNFEDVITSFIRHIDSLKYSDNFKTKDNLIENVRDANTNYN
jgi:hypothetical protein